MSAFDHNSQLSGPTQGWKYCASRSVDSERTKATISAQGFTLIEVVLVVVIVALISSLFGGKFEAVQGWRVKSGIRQIAHAWEAIYAQAVSSDSSYRMIIDLDQQAYFVRKEVQDAAGEGNQVDYLAGMRTRREKERRAQKQNDEIVSSEEEYVREDARQAQDLDRIFFQYLYADSHTGFRLGLPLELPELGEPISLPEGLEITGVKVRGKLETDGQTFVRVSARSGSEFALIYVRALEQDFTLLNDPGTGSFSVLPGHLDFEWILQK